MEQFFFFFYGGLLQDKSISPIDDIYQLTSGEILKPTNNLILLWIGLFDILF